MSMSPSLISGDGVAVDASSLKPHAVACHCDMVTLNTTERIELIDLTPRVRDFIRRLHVSDGLLHVWSLHTTCSVFVNEDQEALKKDIRRLLERLVPRDEAWLHNDPAHSDCDRSNADSHLRAMLCGQGVTLPLTGGDLLLGYWQRILFADLDGPRARTVCLWLLGIV